MRSKLDKLLKDMPVVLEQSNAMSRIEVALQKIMQEVTTLREETKLIKKILRKQTAANENEEGSFPKLPITTVEDLDLLEKIIEDQKEMKILVRICLCFSH